MGAMSTAARKRESTQSPRAPRTLRRDHGGGTIIYPKHVHKALRRYLGVERSAGVLRFPFNNTEDFAFFT